MMLLLNYVLMIRGCIFFLNMLFIFGIPQSLRGETGETLLFVHRNLLIGVKRTPRPGGTKILLVRRLILVEIFVGSAEGETSVDGRIRPTCC